MTDVTANPDRRRPRAHSTTHSVRSVEKARAEATVSRRRVWLDVQAAADWLGVEERFIRRLVAERRVTFYKVGKHLRFDGADLDEFLAASRVDRCPGV